MGIQRNFEDFNDQNKNAQHAIAKNDTAERLRARYFSKVIVKNYRRGNNVIVGNSRIVLKLKKKVSAHRQTYLKKRKRKQG